MATDYVHRPIDILELQIAASTVQNEAFMRYVTNPSNLIGVEFKNDRIALYERTNGEFKELGFVTIPPLVGDIIRLEVKGANATVKKNGAIIIGPKPTAGTNATWTWSGVVSRSFPVDPWIDNYEAGPV